MYNKICCLCISFILLVAGCSISLHDRKFDAQIWRDDKGRDAIRFGMVDDLVTTFDLKNWPANKITSLLGEQDIEFTHLFPDADLVYYLGDPKPKGELRRGSFLLFIRPTREDRETHPDDIGSEYFVYVFDTKISSH